MGAKREIDLGAGIKLIGFLASVVRSRSARGGFESAYRVRQLHVRVVFETVIPQVGSKRAVEERTTGVLELFRCARDRSSEKNLPGLV